MIPASVVVCPSTFSQAGDRNAKYHLLKTPKSAFVFCSVKASHLVGAGKTLLLWHCYNCHIWITGQ